MISKWICLTLSRNMIEKGDVFIKKEYSKKLGKNFKDIKIFDDGLNDNAYVFVKLDDVESGVDKIRENSLAISVLPSWENPSLVAEKEIESLFAKKTVEKLSLGDLVYVTGGGVYSGLYGLVLEDFGDMVDVFFRFHLFPKKERIERQNLIFQKNCLHLFKVDK